MKTILLKLNFEIISFNGSYKDDWGNVRKFDGFKVKHFSGQRVYIAAMNNGMRLSEVAKKMEFENGNVLISFGKVKTKIGEYE